MHEATKPTFRQINLLLTIVRIALGRDSESGGIDTHEDVLKMLERGQLTEGHARAVLAVPDHEGRRALARKIVQKGMSVRAAERAARWAGAKTKQRRQQVKLDPALVARAKKAADRITGFSSRVVSNRLEITFADETELEELVEALERVT